MNKKSAIVTAGGLAASFVAGMGAVSFNWGLAASPSAVQAAPSASGRVKPIIKHRTIVVHRKGKAPGGSQQGARSVVVPSSVPATGALATTSASHVSGDDGEGADH